MKKYTFEILVRATFPKETLVRKIDATSPDEALRHAVFLNGNKSEYQILIPFEHPYVLAKQKRAWQ